MHRRGKQTLEKAGSSWSLFLAGPSSRLSGLLDSLPSAVHSRVAHHAAAVRHCPVKHEASLSSRGHSLRGAA